MWRGYRQEESVYNLIPRPAEQVVKPPMYRSKHDAALPPSCSTFGLQGTTKLTANENGGEEKVFGKSTGKPAATFGKEVLGSIDPTQYLKSGAKSKMAAPPEDKQYHRTVVLPTKPSVPKKAEKPVMGLTTEKNFVVANAVENILAVPRRPVKDDPLPTQSKTFGKVPKYLNKIKRDVENEREYIRQMNNQQSSGHDNDRMRMMTEEEKNEIISGLKKKWEDTHKQYQSLTFNIDTITKVQRKENLEVEMEQIEKAIQKLSKKNIHIYDDSDLW